ncbi:MAG: quinolinate synthase NadA [Marinilabiliaceae bacterium]|nr:quinolinate synthase NadA [Marinilabiliaceae bacterium]
MLKTDKVQDEKSLKDEIKQLKVQKNAIILAHFYQNSEIQDIADYIGDSLALAQWAKETDAAIILLAGVYFMGETAKILSPQKKVLVPDTNAGCSLADSCPALKFEKFVKKHKNHLVVTYVNTTAAVKALSDIVVTSTNATKIIKSIPKNQPVIFGPDKNLGNYINGLTGRDMLLWDGACHVHEKFSLEKILALKKQYPNAKLLAHPECKRPILMISDFIGSTSSLLNYSQTTKTKQFIVATESGILHEMQKKSPHKTFIPAPPIDSTCGCNDCEYMKLNTLEKIYLALRDENPEVQIDDQLRINALKPIERMLELSK